MATKENEHETSEEIISSITDDNDFKALYIIPEEILTSKTDITSMKMADTTADIATVRITPATPALTAKSEISYKPYTNKRTYSISNGHHDTSKDIKMTRRQLNLIPGKQQMWSVTS